MTGLNTKKRQLKRAFATLISPSEAAQLRESVTPKAG